MKKLYLIRHAKSSWAEMNQKDIERPLNKRGLHDAPLMGQLLKNKGMIPEMMVSSPAVRAFTTAQIIAKELDYDVDLIYRESQIYEATLKDMLDVIGSLPDNIYAAMIFGHNPTFTYLCNYFGEELMNLPTCGVISIESSAKSWADVNEHNAKVVRLDFPKMYFSIVR